MWILFLCFLSKEHPNFIAMIILLYPVAIKAQSWNVTVTEKIVTGRFYHKDKTIVAGPAAI